jgi:hypothetical protein
MQRIMVLGLQLEHLTVTFPRLRQPPLLVQGEALLEPSLDSR